MDKIAVVYQSKYGTTKKYAEWIAESVNADLFDVTKTSIHQLSEYQTIVYGGYLFASKVKGFDLIKKNMDKLADKKILVFCVGLSPSCDDVKKAVMDNNFTDEMKAKIPLFVLRGGMDFQKLAWLDKNMMKMMKKMLSKKKTEELTEEEKGMLSVYDKSIDFTEQAMVQPIIEAIQG